MQFFSDFQNGFRSSWSTVDFPTVLSDRTAMACNRFGTIWAVALKIRLSPSKKSCPIYVIDEPFTNDEKSFLFNLKSSFCSQDI